MVTRFAVDPDKKLAAAIRDAIKKVNDLSIPFRLITNEWYQGNKSIFMLQGPGKYKDLSPKYKKWKEYHLGTPYPILRLTGTLEESLTRKGSMYAIAQVFNKKFLVLGTSVPYSSVHQFGRKDGSMPARPPVLTGVEQVAPSTMGKRQFLWSQMIRDYVRQRTSEAFAK